jgi:hypothetical protein
VSSGALGRLPEYFELLPDIFGKTAKPLATFTVHLACHPVQLAQDPRFLCLTSCRIGGCAVGFRLVTA